MYIVSAVLVKMTRWFWCIYGGGVHGVDEYGKDIQDGSEYILDVVVWMLQVCMSFRGEGSEERVVVWVCGCNQEPGVRLYM